MNSEAAQLYLTMVKFAGTTNELGTYINYFHICTLKAYSTVCFTKNQLLWCLQSVLSSFRIHGHSSVSVMIFFPT